ncbi:ubiquinone biosynthesis protein COQ4 homolog, mitochondrial-like isoform X2 [Artemia franciscana]|uniref:Ubiquinone biosynthesis protein COQ4 homolog, mitochondrial n=1 Tax=Artemia franciscana TaxID=6661 RepID=A0AA88HYQ1_ARTSF|nr:hypothetical protein QYM36_005155 [Artemia franciscana]
MLLRYHLRSLKGYRHAASSQLRASTDSQNNNFSEKNTEEKYKPSESYISLSTLQRGILSIGSAIAALLDPTRADMVAILGETTGTKALLGMHERMSIHPEGSEILRSQPRINSSTVDLDKLRSMKEGTLGREYANWLDRNGVSPDTRLPVQFVEDPELAYVMQRYREAHDLIHTVLGMPTNMLGEVAVKWVEGIQTGLPMCVGGGIFGAARLRPKQRQKYLSIYLPWAIRVGQNSKFLMNIYYEKRWMQNLEELRRELSIEHPPPS